MREYKLTKTKRKTISIKINEDGTLEVRAPTRLSKKKIDEFVQSKEGWINKHTEEILKKYKLKKEFTLNFNDYVTIYGKKAYIRPIDGITAKYDEEKEVFYVPSMVKSNQIKEVIIQLYKLVAKSYIPKTVTFFSKEMKVTPTAVRITSANTRWGSCSGKNSVNFSWKLIMADEETIDYVVVHELAHIKEHNHSQEFWKIVESIIPNYKVQKEKLKELGEKLSMEDWDLK